MLWVCRCCAHSPIHISQSTRSMLRSCGPDVHVYSVCLLYSMLLLITHCFMVQTVMCVPRAFDISKAARLPGSVSNVEHKTMHVACLLAG